MTLQKPISASHNWLSLLTNVHPILKIASKSDSISQFEQIHKRMQQNQESFQLIAQRQTEFFILIGKELRWLDLSSLEKGCKKEQDVSTILASTAYKIIKIHQHILQPRFILLEPVYGQYMALLSQHQVSVMKLPLHMNVYESQLIDSKQAPIADFIYKNDVRNPIVKIRWLPESIDQQCNLCILSLDATFRIFNVNHSTQQPVFTYLIGRGNEYTRQIAATSSQYCSDLDEWQASSFDFVQDIQHKCVAMLTVMKSGAIYKLLLNEQFQNALHQNDSRRAKIISTRVPIYPSSYNESSIDQIAVDIHILSTPVPIVCISNSSGTVDVAVYISHENINNDMSNRIESSATLCLYETIDLRLMENNEGSTSTLSSKSISHTAVNMISNKSEPDALYISHRNGTHRLRFTPWIYQLSSFLSSAKDRNDMAIFLENHVSTTVQALVNTAPLDSGTTNPIVGMCIFSNYHLGFYLLSLTSALQLLGHELIISQFKDNLVNDRNKSKAINAKSTQDISSTLQTNPYADTVTIVGQGPIFPSKIVLPQDDTLYQKYPFFLENETFLRNIFKLVEQQLKMSNDLEIQSLEIKDRLELILEEHTNCKKNLSYALEIASKTQAAIAKVNERVNSAITTHHSITKRIDSKLQDLLYRHSDRLTSFEKQYHRTLKDLDAWFTTKGEPMLIKLMKQREGYLASQYEKNGEMIPLENSDITKDENVYSFNSNSDDINEDSPLSLHSDVAQQQTSGIASIKYVDHKTAQQHIPGEPVQVQRLRQYLEGSLIVYMKETQSLMSKLELKSDQIV